MATIDLEKLLISITGILDQVNIPYFITGGFAISLWGRPRATFDIDIVIELLEPKIDVLAKALRHLYQVGYIDEAMAKSAIHHSGEFNFIDGATGLKVDFFVAKKDELSALKFKRRIAKKINHQSIYFISPEDLILSKLEWHKQGESTRQLEDIESILKISGDKLDHQYLKSWAKRLGVLDILNKLI